MKCPHCLTEYHCRATTIGKTNNSDGSWRILYEVCPACLKTILTVQRYKANLTDVTVFDEHLVYPRGISRTPLPKDVPDKFAEDYKEASLVLADSPKSSAALSRRCLQHVLQEKGGVKKGNSLASQIDKVMPSLPSDLAGMIDTVRVMGNFAAHPLKDTNTGEIIEVDPEEAEWLLDTLEMLFDHYFVKPAEIQRKRDAIDAKLADAGKPSLK